MPCNVNKKKNERKQKTKLKVSWTRWVKSICCYKSIELEVDQEMLTTQTSIYVQNWVGSNDLKKLTWKKKAVLTIALLRFWEERMDFMKTCFSSYAVKSSKLVNSTYFYNPECFWKSLKDACLSKFYWVLSAREGKHSGTSEETTRGTRTGTQTKPEAGTRRGDGEIKKGYTVFQSCFEIIFLQLPP